ncbi:MAG: flagellar biosynthesis protein FlhF [Desulfobacterales bacterium]|jgi:flagellar biosynthesis protein FlhF
MQIKRFEAKDMQTALRLIKKELGSDAVILSARSLKKENKIIGRAKAVGVEVTAAVDGYHLSAEIKPAIAAGALNNYRRNATNSHETSSKGNFRQSFGNRMKTLYGRKRPHQLSSTAGSDNDDVLADIFQHLLSQEVKRDIANEIIDALKVLSSEIQIDTTGQIISDISNILKQKRTLAEAPLGNASGCKVIAVVGPTGVGKTTTVAKLAARYVIERHKNVALISLDSDRIGGSGDLKVYAKAIGVPVKTAGTPVAFKAAVAEFQEFDIVLVDTCGFNPKKQDQIDDLKACMNCIGGIEIHLALSATGKESDLLNTFRSLNTNGVQHVIFTKMDESCTYGNLINVLMHHPLPLSFVTNGREVPNAIETGSMDKIVEYLLGTFKKPKTVLNSDRADPSIKQAPARNDGGTFVANKNSDVFHHPDCKWTQKIKSKNMITFSSAQAAEMAHFMPCQDCRPAQRRQIQAGLPASDKRRSSNFS